jgi:hypothetical protein
MPSAPRIFSRNQYAPVIFWEAETLRTAGSFAMDDSARHSAFGIFPRPTYAGGVKFILLCFAVVVCSSLTGCTSGKKKSRYRNYEGDSSPGITIFEEKPGYPLNTR